MTDVEQKNRNGINDFFWWLHFLVSLADHAKASIKLWEGLLTGDTKVGSLNHGSYSKGESDTLCLIRTVSKSVSKTACKKNVRMVTFATFLKENNNMSDITLYLFSGNRFNILFVNDGGVFELYSKLKECYDKIEKEINFSHLYAGIYMFFSLNNKCCGRI